MTRCIVVDLDGTLCWNEHRVHLVAKEDGEVKDWDVFHAACPDDDPNVALVNLIQAMHESYEIVVVTGRTITFRSQTEAWLSKHGIPFWQQIIMRDEHDRRSNSVIKTEAAERLSRTGYEIIAWIEDDPRSAKALREMGIPVLTVVRNREEPAWMQQASTP